MTIPRSRTVAALGVAVLSLVAGCGGTAAQSDPNGKVTLTFVGYGGTGQQAMVTSYQKPYTAAHPNVTFVNASPPDESQVKAQVMSNSVTWDVVSVAPAAAEQNCGTLYTPLDTSGIDTSTLAADVIGKCYLGSFINADPIAYLDSAFPDPATAPKTLADFFDLKKFPGKRGLTNNVQAGLLEYGALGSGVSPDSLYPLDVQRSLKQLDTIRDDTIFAENVGALQQAVASKQVSMFVLPESRIVPLLDEGIKITVIWDTTVTAMNGFAIPKGSKNTAAAQQFIRTLVDPQDVAGLSDALGTQPVNTAAKLDLSPNAKLLQVAGPQNTGKTVSQDVEWYAKNYNQATSALSNWVVG